MEHFKRIEGLLHHGVDTFSVAQYEFTYKNHDIYVWHKLPYEDNHCIVGDGWSFVEKPRAYPVGHYTARTGHATLDEALAAAVERISLVQA
jgi:hypothetical protein